MWPVMAFVWPVFFFFFVGITYATIGQEYQVVLACLIEILGVDR